MGTLCQDWNGHTIGLKPCIHNVDLFLLLSTIQLQSCTISDAQIFVLAYILTDLLLRTQKPRKIAE